ncbi:unnamed protein product [Plutella xylostella]|uniref:(diamondback moth) hypothetical protein n=1 Tax=Plutella xylostella TaxID=51655 RepID=A0A8S4GDJ2_PLUXY|nr:unnamed protein product [Plutella xylostella]
MSEELNELIKSLRIQIKEDMVAALTDKLEEKLKDSETRIITLVNANTDEKFLNIQQEVENLKRTNEEHEERLRTLERQIRQRNLVLFGVSDEKNSYEELETLIKGVIEGSLEVTLNASEIEFARRMGKKSGENRPRPIVFAVTTLGKKIKILQNKNKLENTGSYIKEDFPPKVLEKRKVLQKQLQEEISKGNTAKIVYDRLIVINKSNKRSLSISPPQKQQQQEKPIAKTVNSNIQPNKKQKMKFKKLQSGTSPHFFPRQIAKRKKILKLEKNLQVKLQTQRHQIDNQTSIA